MENYDVKIIVCDGNGEIIRSQDYREYSTGSRDIDIQRVLYGSQLFELLYSDLNVIRYDELTGFILTTIMQNDRRRTAMQLLGRIAEAIVVRNCRDTDRINQRYFSIARRKDAKISTARRFIALGTGLNYTKIHYPLIYNPSDTQRDIVWINGDGEYATMRDREYSKNSTRIAGLQIKASMNGMQYVYPAVLNERYDVPIIYFDLNNDYERVLREAGKNQNIPDIHHPRCIDPNGYDEFLNYVDLINALVEDKLKPEDLIINANWYNDVPMKNALVSTALSARRCVNRIDYELKI